jgi:hypothetical protein
LSQTEPFILSRPFSRRIAQIGDADAAGKPTFHRGFDQAKRLFAEGTIPAAFKLIDSKISSLGVIVANYKREDEVRTGSFG